MQVTLSRAQARDYPLGQAGLRPPEHRDIESLLRARRCIQLDPLAPMGTNADLRAALVRHASALGCGEYRYT